MKDWAVDRDSDSDEGKHNHRGDEYDLMSTYHQRREGTKSYLQQDNPLSTGKHPPSRPNPNFDPDINLTVNPNHHLQQQQQQQGKKKKLTVAKSPKFSKMSWERKAEAAAGGGGGGDADPPKKPLQERQHSAPRLGRGTTGSTYHRLDDHSVTATTHNAKSHRMDHDNDIDTIFSSNTGIDSSHHTNRSMKRSNSYNSNNRSSSAPRGRYDSRII